MDISKERMIELCKNAPDGAVEYHAGNESYWPGYRDGEGRAYPLGGNQSYTWVDDNGDDFGYIKLDFTVIDGMAVDEKPEEKEAFDRLSPAVYLDAESGGITDKQLSREEYDKGMRDAMKDIAKLVGRKFAVDIGYADLPKAVESVIDGYCSTIESMMPSDEKPVYTKAMQEAGELPPVGSAVSFHRGDSLVFGDIIDGWGEGDKIQCVAHSTDADGDDIAVFRHENGLSISMVFGSFKPIDTRTDQEKLIDELRKYVSKSDAESMLLDSNLNITLKGYSND